MGSEGSVLTGKQRYDAIEEFERRTVAELADPGGEVFRRDTVPQPDEVLFVREQLAGADRVLELGCGLGVWGPIVRDIGARYLGVDAIAKRVGWAQRTNGGKGIDFMVGDARSIRLKQRIWTDDPGPEGEKLRQFDAVLLVTVLQHMTFTHAVATLETAALHLKQGGRAILLESMLIGGTMMEAEAQYRRPDCPSHMIPKPISELRARVPGFAWSPTPRSDGYVLTRLP